MTQFALKKGVLILKELVPSNLPRHMWILDGMGNTLRFTGKTVKYFSRYRLVCAHSESQLMTSTSLEKPDLTTDVTTSTDALTLFRRDTRQNNSYIEW